MRTENEIKQKLKDVENRRAVAKMMKHEFLETYCEGLINGLKWVTKGD